MNVKHIFNEIEKVDPEVYGRLDTRRHAMKGFLKTSGKIALASLPVVMGGMFKKAYGQTGGSSLFDILNYALTLEYLEDEFYKAALAAPNLIPSGAPRGAIETIGKHETAHVNLLRGAITAAGGTPVAKPTFDLTGGNGSNNGPFKDAFTNYALFLAVAQTFEDTGVRAYKGQAAMDSLIANNDVLQVALQIHSVEARHASHIRQMRKANGGLVPAGVNVKPWITLKQSGIDTSAVQASYDGEEITMQATVQITGIASGITAEAASEAFDEPLTKEAVLAIVDPFIV
ncbi:MAG: ferritin-like domain-containing protein [Chitinophagaceae bacterium]|nr:MAG: ferritin-like domain-containing protein [Chitinophagaceae bacterium]